MNKIISICFEEIAIQADRGASLESLWQLLKSRCIELSVPLLLDSFMKRHLTPYILKIPSLILTYPNINVTMNADDILTLLSQTANALLEIESKIHIFLPPHITWNVISEGFTPAVEIERTFLIWITRSRSKGLNQADLSTALKIGPKEAFRHLKNLIKHKIIHKVSVLASKCGHTNRLIHRRYLDYSPVYQQSLKIHRNLQQVDDLESALDVTSIVGVNPKSLVVLDRQMIKKKICAILKSALNQVMICPDLMVAIQMEHSRPNSKNFYKILHELEAEKHIEFIRTPKVILSGNPAFHRCVRFIEDYPKASGAEKNSESASGLSFPLESPSPSSGGFLIDLHLEAQIFDLICKAGSNGITSKEICQSLNNIGVKTLTGAISKISNQAGKQKSKNFMPVFAQYENVGRARRYRYFAVHLMNNDGEPQADRSSRSSTTGSVLSLSPAVFLESEASSKQFVSSSLVSSAPTSPFTYHKSPLSVSQTISDSPLFSKNIKTKKHHASQISTTTQNRRKMILEILDSEKMVIIQKSFMTELEKKLSLGTKVDRKTIMRDIEYLESNKLLKSHNVQVIRHTGSKVLKLFIMKPDLEIEMEEVKEFMNKISDDVLYKSSSLKSAKIEYEVEVERVVLHDDDEDQLKVKDNEQDVGDSLEELQKFRDIQIEYGFVSGKMLRVKLFHRKKSN